jgi:hypothetical protein
MAHDIEGIDPAAKPSGSGCAECSATEGWWLHLRRCAECGHVGCCDSSPSRHARAHAATADHPIIASFEPGEDWFYSFVTDDYVDTNVRLAAPHAHPASQPTPGPAGRVPADWQSHLH